MRMNRLVLPLLLLAASAPAMASDACMPVASEGWIRKPPADLPVMAGYAKLENPCDKAVTIVAASTDAFADTSIHVTRVEDGVSRMRVTPPLELPAGATVGIDPGGLHLMLVNPKAPLQTGDKVSVVFALDDGRTLAGEFELRSTAP